MIRVCSSLIGIVFVSLVQLGFLYPFVSSLLGSYKIGFFIRIRMLVVVMESDHCKF